MSPRPRPWALFCMSRLLSAAAWWALHVHYVADPRVPAPPHCRPPVPVPALLRQGVSEQQVREVAEKATLYINKGLGA